MRDALFPMKLQQGQIWQCGTEFVRIIDLQRLEVGYKSAADLKFTDSKHKRTSKKDFCRLLKGATLITPTPPTQAPSPPQQPA